MYWPRTTTVVPVHVVPVPVVIVNTAEPEELEEPGEPGLTW